MESEAYWVRIEVSTTVHFSLTFLFTRYSTFFTETSVLRNDTSSTAFLDLLMSLKDLKFELPLNRDLDNTDFWNDYFREQKTREESLANKQPTAAPVSSDPTTQVASTRAQNQTENSRNPTASAPDEHTSEQIKEMKAENVKLRVLLEKVQIEKQQLQQIVKQYESQIQDMNLELKMFKDQLGPSMDDVLPTLDENDVSAIRNEVQQSQEDSQWSQSVSTLSTALSKIRNDLQLLTESEMSFLTTHVPTVDPVTLMEETGVVLPDTDTVSDDTFDMDIEENSGEVQDGENKDNL